MRSKLVDLLYRDFVFAADRVLAAGAWRDGRPLSDDDVAWMTSLGHVLRMELFDPIRRREIAPPSEGELRAMHGDR